MIAQYDEMLLPEQRKDFLQKAQPGLYISRRLIEAMGGKICIESSGMAGEGSSFCIRLPMAR
ncbi:MAG: hypothetical protein NVS4B7_07440 [Ktedonobacteraceae bacterium]